MAKIKITLMLDPLVQVSEIMVAMSQRVEVLAQRIVADAHGHRIYASLIRADQDVITQLGKEMEEKYDKPNAGMNPDEAREHLMSLPVATLIEMVDEIVVDPDNSLVMRRKLKDMPIYYMVNILVPFMIDDKHYDPHNRYHRAARGGDTYCWWDW